MNIEFKSQFWWETENNLTVKDGRLLMCGKELNEIAKNFGTPLYVYNLQKIKENYRNVAQALKRFATGGLKTRVYYAMKANGSIEVLKALKQEDAFIDTSSVGEVKRCLDLGFSPSKLIFTGTNFGLGEFEFLAKSGILFNVDSFSQLKRLKQYAPLKISIRLNPSIGGVGFNEKFDMSGKGAKASRLGIYIDRIIEAFHTARSYGLEPICIHQHVGSNWLQSSSFDTFMESVKTILGVVIRLEKEGFDIQILNLGGGLGVRSNEKYPEFPLLEYAQEITKEINNAGTKIQYLAIEPGRYIVGDAGVLLATVNTVEQKNKTNYIGLDIGFNAYHHKFLYGIENTIVNISKIAEEPASQAAVVGYLGEQGDVFSENELLPKTEEGDIFMLYPAGAYCASELAQHHLLPVPKELPLTSENEKLSLKNFCAICPKSCCYLGTISVTPDEKETIVKKTGKEENFITEKSGVIQINNTPGKPCLFLAADGLTCTIQEIKPTECKAYPLLVGGQGDGQMILAEHCPARNLLDQNYLLNAKNELDKIPSNLREPFYQINKALGHC